MWRAPIAGVLQIIRNVQLGSRGEREFNNKIVGNLARLNLEAEIQIREWLYLHIPVLLLLLMMLLLWEESEQQGCEIEESCGVKFEGGRLCRGLGRTEERVCKKWEGAGGGGWGWTGCENEREIWEGERVRDRVSLGRFIHSLSELMRCG